MSTELPGVELLVPATWDVLDLDPVSRVGSIARLVERSVPAGAGFAPNRVLMRDGLERAAAAAVAMGAVLAFVWSGKASDGAVAGASLYVSYVDAASASADAGPPSVADMAKGLADHLGGVVVELAAGPGARVRRRETLPAGAAAPFAGAGGPETEVVQWYVPHASGRRLALLTFSTPNVGLGDELGEVFDAIADTLRWTA